MAQNNVLFSLFGNTGDNGMTFDDGDDLVMPDDPKVKRVIARTTTDSGVTWYSKAPHDLDDNAQSVKYTQDALRDLMRQIEQAEYEYFAAVLNLENSAPALLPNFTTQHNAKVTHPTCFVNDVMKIAKTDDLIEVLGQEYEIHEGELVFNAFILRWDKGGKEDKPSLTVQAPASAKGWDEYSKRRGYDLSWHEQDMDLPIQIVLPYGINASEVQAFRSGESKINPVTRRAAELGLETQDTNEARQYIQQAALDALIDRVNEPFKAARANRDFLKARALSEPGIVWPNARSFEGKGLIPSTDAASKVTARKAARDEKRDGDGLDME